MVPKKIETVPRKTPYQKATLTRYGRLKDLVAGGTGNAQEASSSRKPRP